jgi:hypothetical protein
MRTYTFTVILGDQTEMTEDLAEALAAAGCDDGLAGSSGGACAVIFDREAESLEQAVRSACRRRAVTRRGSRSSRRIWRAPRLTAMAGRRDLSGRKLACGWHAQSAAMGVVSHAWTQPRPSSLRACHPADD